MPMAVDTVGRWVAAARPKTLLLAVAPVMAGLVVAFAETGRVAIATAVITLLAAIAIQVGTNLHNDATDFERGNDTGSRLGPPRAAAQGWFSVRQVKGAAHLAFAAALVLGLFLVWRGGWPILLLGLASLAAGYAYTGGPRPIAYGPYGELFVLLFFGVAAVTGTYFLQTLTLDARPVAIGLALGLPAAAVLLLNNYRDLETDRQAGRRTLCHYLGYSGARAAYAAFLLMPYPLLFAVALPGQTWPVLAALPLAGVLIAQLYRGANGHELNRLLAQTARYAVALVVLLAVGLALPSG